MLKWISDLMNDLGYWAITFLMFLENIVPPIPSEVVMPLAGFTAAQGKLSLVGVIIAGTIGAVLGALPIYYLGRTMGPERLKQWADKHGRWLTVCGEDIDKAKKWFDRYGKIAIMLGHLAPGVRSFISLPAGMTRMNLPLFLLYTAIG